MNQPSCYIRCCTGVAVAFARGVYIRWTSPYDPATGRFTQGTPSVPVGINPPPPAPVPGPAAVETPWKLLQTNPHSANSGTLHSGRPLGALNTTATFIPVYTLSIGRSGSGTVSGDPLGAFNTSIDCGRNCSAKFPQGTAVTLTATPPAGGVFVNWTGACSGTAPTCSLTISKDASAQANFK